MNTFTNLVKRAAIALFAVGAFAPCAVAGTYTIVDLEWYPSTSPGVGTDGGFINLSGNSVNYGIDKSAGGPNNTTGASSGYAAPSIIGNFRWKVRWTGDSTETPPYQVDAVLKATGSASCTSGANCFSADPSGDSSCATHGTLNDAFFPLTTSASSTLSVNGTAPQSDVESDSVTKTAYAGATFTQVSPGVYEGYVNYSVTTGAQIDGQGDISSNMGTAQRPRYIVYSAASTHITLNATISLSTIDGQSL